MRTAEEIIDEEFEKAAYDDYMNDIYIRAVNQARKEALEAAANNYIPDGNPQVFRDKILSLINELK